MLGRWEAGLSRGVLSGGLRLIEGHAGRRVAVLLLHRLLGLVNIWTLLLLLLLGVGLGRSCHGIPLSQSVRLLGYLLLVWCVVLLHGILRGLLVLLLRLLLLLLRRHLLLLLHGCAYLRCLDLLLLLLLLSELRRRGRLLLLLLLFHFDVTLSHVSLRLL